MKKLFAIFALAVGLQAGASTLTFSVPHPAGGAPDVWARLVEQGLGERIKRPVIVVNKPAGDGRVALEQAATSTGNNEIALASTGPFLFNRVVYQKLNYSFDNFDVIGPLARVPLVFSVSNRSGLKNFNDVVKLSQQRPVNCAASSASSLFLGKYVFNHLKIENVTWIPFKGSPDMSTQLAAGNIDCAFDTLLFHLPLHTAGKIQIVAVSSVSKHSAVPDAVLMSSAVPNLSFYNWYGIAIPKTWSTEERDKIFTAVRQTVSTPEFKESVRSRNLEPVDPPVDSNTWVQQEYQRWETIRQKLKIDKID